jgi:hypothetical protein
MGVRHMANSEIGKLVEELIAKYDTGVLEAAARQLILRETGKEEANYTREEVAEFVAKIDFDKLMTMKAIADEIALKEALSKRS